MKQTAKTQTARTTHTVYTSGISIALRVLLALVLALSSLFTTSLAWADETDTPTQKTLSPEATILDENTQNNDVLNEPEIPTHIVTFDASGGTVTPATIAKTHDSAIGTLPIPTRPGYAFIGWYTAITDGAKITPTTNVTADITYYAYWKAAFSGWEQQHSTWYYYTDDVMQKSTVLTIAGQIYSFSSTGAMAVGWAKIDEFWRYHSLSGAALRGWQKLGGLWYYLNPGDGVMLSDWQDIGGKRYYLGGAEDGSMKSGWQKLGGSWYYLGAAEDGALKTGWQKLGNLWYYLNPGDGIMLSDWQDIGGQRYYLGGAEDGSMKTGWYQIGSGWYNFASDGHCVNPENPQTSPGTRLDVPLLLQMPDYPTGCEAASVAMMLRYAGHDVSVADVVRIMPYHSSNPNLGFVGNPRTWSGVTIYPPALLNVVRAYTGSAVDLTGASLDTFKNYLDTGRPVVCWIQESSGLHCVAITGYDLQNFYYNDPYGGKDKAVSYARLTTMRAALGNRALSY